MRESRSVVPTGIPSLCLSVAAEVVVFILLLPITSNNPTAFPLFSLKSANNIIAISTTTAAQRDRKDRWAAVVI